MIVMRYGRRGWKKGVWVWTVGRAGGGVMCNEQCDMGLHTCEGVNFDMRK